MNDSAATVVLAGIAAFSALVPPLSQAVQTDIRYVRLGQAYASAATFIVGFLLAKATNNTLPLTMAGFVVGLELLAFWHAQQQGVIHNG